MAKLKFFRVLLVLAFITSYELLVTSYELFAQDKIVAIVNNDIVTQKDLNDFVNFVRLQLSKEYKGAELEKRIESAKVDLLDKLIEDRLILQEANKNGIIVDENRIKAKINEIKKRYASLGEFQQDLTRQGLVQADIESRIREQFLMYNIIELKVKSKIVLRPDEVTDFYNKNLKEFETGEERELTVIALENNDLAKAFAYNLKTGQKLEDLATRYPITVNQIKARDDGELRKDIKEAIFKLGLGEVSEPINIDDKYYLFKLDNIIPTRQLTLSEAQDNIHNFLLEEKMQEGLKNWLDELKKQSYIKIIQN